MTLVTVGALARIYPAIDETLAIPHCFLGQIMVSVGEWHEAVRHLERAAALAPTDGRVQAVMAKAYARLGDGRRAAEAEAKARRFHATLRVPDPIRYEIEQLGVSKERYFARARALIEAGNYAEAAVQLASAVENFPEDPDTEFWLGICYMKTDRPALAIEHLSKAVRIRTDHFSAHAALGSLLLSKEDLDLAMSHLRRALVEAPSPALQHAELATALAGTERLDEAITEFERAAEFGPLNAQMHNNWGFALFHQGRYLAAVEQYRLALQRNPNYVNAHFHLGAALEKLDRKAEAIEAYREAVRLDPKHHPAIERVRALGGE